MSSLSNRIAIKTVIGIALAGVVLFSQSGVNMRPCATGATISAEEWQMLIVILDRELRNESGLKPIKSQEDTNRSLTNILYE